MDRLDIYEYISFILPGGVVLAVILYGFEIVPLTANVNATFLILLTAIAFVLGHLNVAIANFVEPLAWGRWPGTRPPSTAGLFGKRGLYDPEYQRRVEERFDRLFPATSNFQQRFNLAYTLLRQEQLDGHLQVLNKQIGFYRNMATAVTVSLGILIATSVTGHHRLNLWLWIPLDIAALLLLVVRYRRFWVRFGDEVVRGTQAWITRRDPAGDAEGN